MVKKNKENRKKYPKERIFDENIDTKELLTGIEYTSEDKEGTDIRFMQAMAKQILIKIIC